MSLIYRPPYRLRYYRLRPHELIRHYYYQAKYVLQRGLRGYADCDVWNLDAYLSNWLPDALMAIKGDKYCGHPVQICSETIECAGGDCPGQVSWEDALDAMADAFRAHREILNWDHDWGSPGYKLAETRYKDGSLLFVKWFGALWT